ncbi:MAG: cytochrome C oxidase Cbb3 [Cyclobacteriaceae bacterium]|nr:cytochrome C oxidase Cbb3 [Cyclobacteriaceae bacterium]
MFKYYFDQIENVEIWPIISLLIFLTFFIGLIVWLIRIDKKYINKMKNLPIEENKYSD